MDKSADDVTDSEATDSEVAKINDLGITQAVETIGAGESVEIIERGSKFDFQLSERELELLWWIAESEPDVRFKVLQRFFSNAKYRNHFLNRPYMITNAVVGLNIDLRQRITTEIIKPAIAASVEDKDSNLAVALLGTSLRLGSTIPGFSQFTAKSFHSDGELQVLKESKKRIRTMRDFMRFNLVRTTFADVRKEDANEFYKLIHKRNRKLLQDFGPIEESLIKHLPEEQLNTIAEEWLQNAKKSNSYISYSLLEELAPRVSLKTAKTIVDFFLKDYLNTDDTASLKRINHSSSIEAVLLLIPKLSEADQNEIITTLTLALEKVTVLSNQSRANNMLSCLIAIPSKLKIKSVKQVLGSMLNFHINHPRQDIFRRHYKSAYKLLQKTEPSAVPELVTHLLALQQEAIEKKSVNRSVFSRYLQIWVGGACKNVTSDDSSIIIAQLDQQIEKESSLTKNLNTRNDDPRGEVFRTTGVVSKYTEAYSRLIQKLPLEELNKRYPKLEEIEDGAILASLIARYATQKKKFSSEQRVDQFNLLLTTDKIDSENFRTNQSVYELAFDTALNQLSKEETKLLTPKLIERLQNEEKVVRYQRRIVFVLVDHLSLLSSNEASSIIEKLDSTFKSYGSISQNDLREILEKSIDALPQESLEAVFPILVKSHITTKYNEGVYSNSMQNLMTKVSSVTIAQTIKTALTAILQLDQRSRSRGSRRGVRVLKDLHQRLPKEKKNLVNIQLAKMLNDKSAYSKLELCNVISQLSEIIDSQIALIASDLMLDYSANIGIRTGNTTYFSDMVSILPKLIEKVDAKDSKELAQRVVQRILQSDYKKFRPDRGSLFLALANTKQKIELDLDSKARFEEILIKSISEGSSQRAMAQAIKKIASQLSDSTKAQIFDTTMRMQRKGSELVEVSAQLLPKALVDKQFETLVSNHTKRKNIYDADGGPIGKGIIVLARRMSPKMCKDVIQEMYNANNTELINVLGNALAILMSRDKATVKPAIEKAIKAVTIDKFNRKLTPPKKEKPQSRFRSRSRDETPPPKPDLEKLNQKLLESLNQALKGKVTITLTNNGIAMTNTTQPGDLKKNRRSLMLILAKMDPREFSLQLRSLASRISSSSTSTDLIDLKTFITLMKFPQAVSQENYWGRTLLYKANPQFLQRQRISSLRKKYAKHERNIWLIVENAEECGIDPKLFKQQLNLGISKR